MNKSSYLKTPVGAVIICTAVFFNSVEVFSQTIKQGPICTETWTVDNGPYIIAANSEVQGGCVLTIEPGVEVIIGPNIRLTVYGGLIAIGEPDRRIVFSSPDPNNLQETWDRILIYNPVGKSSQFQYCDISNALIGVEIDMVDFEATSEIPISNCSFERCATGIYGYSKGYKVCWFCTTDHIQPFLNPTIKNCRFASMKTGCEFYIAGIWDYICCAGGATGVFPGYANPRLINNIFSDIDGPAAKFSIGEYPGSSYVFFDHNTIVNCLKGISVIDPYNVEIRNNIFKGTQVAVERSGGLSGEVSHNCFFGNGTNFVGYSENYGKVLWKNSRDVPADLFYNIFEDPKFEDEQNFLVALDSPCVDSGCATKNCPVEIYNDVCVPPSRGTSVGDIGAYGGPGACTMVLTYPTAQKFIRGDANPDGDVDQTDAITILGYLFIGEPAVASCAKAMDADDNSFLEITDAVYLLRYKFLNSIAPPAPFLACGTDPSQDPLTCQSYPLCP